MANKVIEIIDERIIVIDESIGSALLFSHVNDTGRDDHTQYHNDARALTWIGTRSTSDLPEGTNLYYTTTRANSDFDTRIATLAGSANGLAQLDGSGLVPSSQLPSYVDDVIEVADFASLPVTGETGKIYVTLDTNLQYRWSGTVYVEISKSLALGETSATAYRGDRGKIAYDHSQDNTTDVHTQYILVDGTRAFSAVVSGVAPTADAHLTTKLYVDSAIMAPYWQRVGTVLSPTTAGDSIDIDSTVASTSSTTGALVVAGGVGIGGALNVGGNIGLTGVSKITCDNDLTIGQAAVWAGQTSTCTLDFATITLQSVYAVTLTTNSGRSVTMSNSGSFISGTNNTVSLGTDSNRWSNTYTIGLHASGVTNITDTTASTSATTGALVVTGGIGVGGSAYIAGALNIGANVTMSGVGAILDLPDAGASITVGSRIKIDVNNIRLRSNANLSWSNSTTNVTVLDTHLTRKGAGIISQENAANAQTFRVANIAGTDGEYGVIGWQTTSNVLTIGAQKAGTGTIRPVAFVGSAFSMNNALTLSTTLSVVGTAAPAVSAAGECTMYFDSTANKLKISENGGAYVDVV